MISPVQYTKSLHLVRNAILLVGFIAFVGQCYLDFSRTNVFVGLLCLGALIPACLTAFHPRNSQDGAALVAVPVLVYIIGNSLVPMVGTLLEGHPTIYTLHLPLGVFTHRWLLAMILLAAQLLVTSAPVRRLSRSIGGLTGKIHLQELLEPGEIWIVGIVANIAFLLKAVAPEVLAKFLDGFSVFMWAPYILLIPPYSRWGQSNGRYMMLGMLFCLNVAIGVVTNSRFAIAGPVICIVCAWLVSLMAGNIVIDARVKRRFVVLGVVGVVLLGQFQDFSTALLMTRDEKEKTTVGEQVADTFEAFLNKRALADYKSHLGDLYDASSVWDEYYLRNHLLARFTSVKYDDVLLGMDQSYHESERMIIEDETKDQILTMLPEPLLRQLGVRIDKKAINTHSVTDVMADLSGNGLIGTNLTGSIIAHAYLLFGWSYLLVLFLGYGLMLFLLQSAARISTTEGGGGARVSSFALIMAAFSYFSISIDTLNTLAGFLMRGFWQTIFFYWLLVSVAKVKTLLRR